MLVQLWGQEQGRSSSSETLTIYGQQQGDVHIASQPSFGMVGNFTPWAYQVAKETVCILHKYFNACLAAGRG